MLLSLREDFIMNIINVMTLYVFIIEDSKCITVDLVSPIVENSVAVGLHRSDFFMFIRSHFVRDLQYFIWIV